MLSITAIVDFLFNIALFINAISFIPQIIHLLKYKTSAGLSLLTFLSFLFIQLLVILHGLVVKDYSMLTGYLLSMVTCGAVVILIFFYKKHRGIKEILESEGISLQEVFDQLPGHVYWKNKSGIFVLSNRNNWEAFGLSSLEDCLGKDDYDLFSKEEANRIRGTDKEVMKKSQLKIIEEKVTKPGGISALYLSHKIPLKNNRGKVVGILGVSIDITKAKQEMEDRLSMLENVIAVMPGHVYWMNKEGIYLGCNNLQAESAGLNARQDIVGRRNKELPWYYHSSELPEVLDTVNNKVMQTGESVLLEETGTLNGGKKVTFLSSKVPLYNNRGEISGMVGISMDITKEKEAQKLLNKERVSQAMLEFISTASHEVRGPVSNVAVLAKLLDENLKTLQNLINTHKSTLDVGKAMEDVVLKALDRCDDICTESERSLASLRNLIRFHWMQIYGVETVMERCDIPYMLDVAIEKSRYLNQNNVKIIKDISPDVPTGTIVTDVENIISALTIVVGNALRFSHLNGKIYIRVEPVKTTDNKTSEYTFFSIVVQDFGIGMHKEQIQQLSPEVSDPDGEKESIYRKPSVQLSCAKIYVQAYGGTLFIESVLEQGTKVTLTVKCHEAKPISEEEKRLVRVMINHSDILPQLYKEKAKHVAGEPLCSALLIEDDSTTRYLTYNKLVGLGCKVTVAVNGREAIKMLLKEHYDLAFLDITLPDINGLEVVRRFREEKGDNNKTNFIVISSHNLPQNEASMQDQGIMAFIAKPVTEQELKEVIDKALNLSHV
jgi:two-component system aerobic respiration control sensor histidine kinase ArcB